MSQGTSSTSGTQETDVETLEELKERLAYWKSQMEAEKNPERKEILKTLVSSLEEQVKEQEGGRRLKKTLRRRRRGGRTVLKKLTKSRKHRK